MLTTYCKDEISQAVVAVETAFHESNAECKTWETKAHSCGQEVDRLRSQLSAMERRVVQQERELAKADTQLRARQELVDSSKAELLEVQVQAKERVQRSEEELSIALNNLALNLKKSGKLTKLSSEPPSKMKTCPVN